MDTLVACPRCLALNRVPLERAAHSQPVCGGCKQELPVHGGVQELTGPTLRTLIQKSGRPVVVDFWAPWCGPCRSFAPVFQQAAGELAGQAVLAKLDSQAHPDGAAAYGIRGIPTLIVFGGGRELGRQSGAMPLPVLKQFLQGFLRPAA